MGSIRLGKAQLCPDCQVIYDDQACPTCGSQNGLWLARVLMPKEWADLYFKVDKLVRDIESGPQTYAEAIARASSDRPTVETPKQEAK